MVDARITVQELLKNDTGIAALCDQSDVHRIKAPVNKKNWRSMIVIREDDNAPNMSDNTERSADVVMQVWLWAKDEETFISLIQAVNAAMAAKHWTRAGVMPDNFIPDPYNYYEKELLFERQLKI
jgi:hypothetical protein